MPQGFLYLRVAYARLELAQRFSYAYGAYSHLFLVVLCGTDSRLFLLVVIVVVVRVVIVIVYVPRARKATFWRHRAKSVVTSSDVKSERASAVYLRGVVAK